MQTSRKWGRVAGRQVGLWAILMWASMGASAVWGQYCEEPPFLPPPIPDGQPSCDVSETRGGGEEGLIAVVINNRLYLDWPGVQAGIAAYRTALEEDGYESVLVKFQRGEKDHEALRARLHQLYVENHLSGAILIGDLPFVTLTGYPTDAYFMDIDTADAVHWHPVVGTPATYDRWDANELEIWVSRLKTTDLPGIRYTTGPHIAVQQHVLVERYLERNIAHRRGAFGSSQSAFAYNQGESSLIYLRNAYDAPEPVGQASKEDYLSRLGSDEYRFVTEAGHGTTDCHLFGEELVCGADYLAANPRPIGIFMLNCLTCRFSAPDCLGSTIVLNPYFNSMGGFCTPEELGSSMLVACGAAAAAGGPDVGVLWGHVGAGRSFGEAYKAHQNARPMPALVLLGDGSLRGGVVKWVGDVGGSWQDYENWLDPDGVARRPEPEDYVRINGAAVTFDLAPSEIHNIWSLNLQNGASLNVEQDRRLFLAGSLLGTPHYAPIATVTMQPGSELQLNRQPAIETAVQCRDVRLVMVDNTEGGVTTLKVGGASSGGTISGAAGFQVGENCALETGVLENSSTDPGSPIKGTLTTDRIDKCNIEVGAGAQVTASICGFSNLTVNSGRVLAGQLSETSVEAYDSNIVSDSISGNGDWDLVGTDVSTGVGTQSGTWNISGIGGSMVGFATLYALNGPLTLRLEHGAQVFVSDAVATEGETGSARCPFAGEYAHGLVYGCAGEDGSPNVLGAGNEVYVGTGAMDDKRQIMYFGSRTGITRDEASCESAAALELQLHSDLAIASDLRVVGSDWDSSGVSLQVGRIWNWDHEGAGTQRIELVSPPPGGDSPAVAFQDVACFARFGDLTIQDCLDPPSPLPVEFVNEFNNSAIDEGPRDTWTPPSDAGPAETAFFRNITVGANRRVYLPVPIYYYGADPVYPLESAGTLTYTPFYKRDGADWVRLTDVELRTSWLKRAVCTYYGDFNGDGRLSNLELAQLRAAINGSAQYAAIYDVDCDGLLMHDNNSPELTTFLYNYSHQPLPACSSGELLMADGLGMAESAVAVDDADDGADDGEPVDMGALAEWLGEQLSAEELAAFVAQATATAADHTEDAIGAEMTELLSYLP